MKEELAARFSVKGFWRGYENKCELNGRVTTRGSKFHHRSRKLEPHVVEVYHRNTSICTDWTSTWSSTDAHVACLRLQNDGQPCSSVPRATLNSMSGNCVGEKKQFWPGKICGVSGPDWAGCLVTRKSTKVAVMTSVHQQVHSCGRKGGWWVVGVGGRG